MRITRTLLPILATCALTLGIAETARAGSFHGVVSQGALQASDYERMRDGRAGTLRIPVRWGNVQPSLGTPQGAWRWEASDAVVLRAAANGVRVLPTLDAPAPGGAADPPTDKKSRRGFAKFAAAVVERYGRGGTIWTGQPFSRPVKAFQIYNEQNGRANWRGKPNPRAYGKLLRVASKKIKRQDRRAEVVLGGMFGTPSGGGAITSWKFLKRLYGMRGVKRAFDTVALHPYSNSMRGIKYVIGKARRVMRANNDRPKLRLTEFGWGSARSGNLNVGRKGQARMLKKAFRLFEGKRREWKLKGVNWFSFQDNPAGACSFCPTSGLFEADRDPKPSWRAFKRAARR